MRRALLIPMLVLPACALDDDSPPPVREVSAAIMVSDDAGLVDSALRTHMQEHLAAIERAQQALMRGRLDEAKASARWIAAHPEHAALSDGAEHMARVRAAAEALAEAPDLREAASMLASVGLACSACHEARGALTTFSDSALPRGDALVDQMRRHQWASERLWQGLIGPSDERWREGALAMARLHLDVGPLARGRDAGVVRTAVRRVRSLSSQAVGLTGQDARATLYGRLVESCVACHQAVRPGAR